MSVKGIRRGFTLLELVVVLTILGAIGGTIGMLLLRQQRFYRGASELLYAREGVRDALGLLATDIRGIATADTVRLLADSAIEIFSNIGSSVVCHGVAENQVGLPPALSSGNTLTSFVTQPDTGDLALFYHASIANGSHWERHRIAGFGPRSPASTCPSPSAFASADLAADVHAFQLTLEAPLTSEVALGAPIRFIRRGRYRLYHASDGDWYLGYRRCNALGASTCGSIQPLSGPYRPYSGDRSATGLLFDYFDAHGARLGWSSSPLEIARVDISARAESRQHLTVEGRAYTPADSATLSIAIRNRWQ